MKKIAFIFEKFIDKNFYGGGEKVFYQLIKRFIQDNYAVDIYCSKSNVAEFSGVNKIIIVNKPYKYKKPKMIEEFYQEVNKLIRQENYDYIIADNISPSPDSCLVQFHSVAYSPYNSTNLLFSLFSRLIKFNRIKYQEKWLRQVPGKIYTVSYTLKKDLVNNFDIPENKVQVIYPGIEFCEDYSDKICSPVNDKRKFIFGLSATGFKRKGGYITLKAIKILKDQGYDFKVRIIYPKFYKNLYIKTLVLLYGIKDYVEPISLQNDMTNFYSSIDCLIMPSISEAFGLVAAEAMLNKKPCIVSSSAGVSEIIQDGENGFIFTMNKHAAKNLAEKMALVVSNINCDKNSEETNISLILNNINTVYKCIINGFNTVKIYNWDKMYKDLVDQLSN